MEKEHSEKETENINNSGCAPITDEKEEQAQKAEETSATELTAESKEEKSEVEAEKEECEVTTENSDGGKPKKKKKRKKLGKKGKIIVSIATIFVAAILIFAIVVVSLMFAPIKAAHGDGNYKDLQALQLEYTLSEEEEAKKVTDFNWTVGNTKNPVSAAEAYEVYRIMFSKLLREENLQTITDGHTKVGSIISTVQSNKKKIGDKMFVNIYGRASVANNDERHYLDIAKKKAVTKNTQISKGWRNFDEIDYVANYLYQPKFLHHEVSLDIIESAYMRKVDDELIAVRNGNLATAGKSNGKFRDGKGDYDFELRNYDIYKSGNYYEVLLYLDAEKSAVQIKNQVRICGKAKEVKFYGKVGFAFVIDENFKIQSGFLLERYRLDSPYGLSFASGNATSMTSEFYYYGDDFMGHDESGNPIFFDGLESEGFAKIK